MEIYLNPIRSSMKTLKDYTLVNSYTNEVFGGAEAIVLAQRITALADQIRE